MRPIVLISLALALTVSSPAAARTAEPALASALTALGEKIEQSPREPALLNDYANLLVRAGHTEEARASYRTALEVDPGSQITLYNFGLLELELGNPRVAGRLLRRALDSDPTFARGHYALGMVLAARRQNLRAVRHYATAFELDPDLMDVDRNPELLFNDLATWAVMESYLTTSVQRGTRLYNNPQPIVGLLIEGLTEPSDETDEPAAAAESDG